jgi:ABC-type transport system involved in multi-copper enzyme maturation permease subunit
MSAVVPSEKVLVIELDGKSPSGLGRFWSAAENWLAALVDRANPILVKETRQALKSRQFVVTFLVVLIACWIVSIVGVTMIGPDIYYAAAGGQMLLAYYAVLAFPLALIVPFTAFRSLAAEQEENTYDLLSITTLSAKQIISGKLWSACVQMAVYLSAVSPCIAFTFLLRGVDALTTAFLIALAVLGSLGLSAIALLIGAIARVKHTQMVWSVALVLGLAWVFGGSLAVAQIVINDGANFMREEGFWVVVAGLMTLYVTTFGLVHSAAAAQIAFASDNRSTTLRWWMLAQQACFCGWLAGVAYAVGVGAIPEIVIVGLSMGAAYWYLAGTLLTAEWPHLSRRVQRSLPQSTAGRAFLTLLNPGPGSGYLFVTSNLTMLTIAAAALIYWADPVSRHMRIDREILFYFAAFTWSYVVAYLGIGRLLIIALRRWVYVPIAAGFLLHIILLLIGVGVPTVIQVASRTYRQQGYTLLQTSNPFWTLGELVDDGPNAVYAEILIFILPAAAVLALLLNVRSVAAELRRQRIAQPIRVAEEEAELHPAPAPKPSSPWDETKA